MYNYGIGGTRLAHQEKPSEKPRYDLCFCGRAYNLNKNADVIVVYGGVNDYIHGDAHFGEMSDRTPETFCGAVYFLMELLKAEYPGKTVVFMTPAHCNYRERSDAEVSCRPMKKSDAKPLQAYVDVITGRYEPNGLLPVQFPADMETVEKQCEDSPRDMECYVDSDGNAYDFAFGLDWNGIINDERVKRYK